MPSKDRKQTERETEKEEREEIVRLNNHEAQIFHFICSTEIYFLFTELNCLSLKIKSQQQR